MLLFSSSSLSSLSVLFFVICLMIQLHQQTVNAMIHNLKIKDDTRGSFFIESFGFEADGVIDLNLTNLHLIPQSPPKDAQKIGFIIKRSQLNYHGFIEEHQGPETCLFELQETAKVHQPFEQSFELENVTEWSQHIEIRSDAVGFYSVYFIVCGSKLDVSFDLRLELYNPGPNYLSSGSSVLPLLYLFFFILYLVTTGWWFWFYMRPKDGRKIFMIHYLMTAALILKMLAVFFHSIELHYLKIFGHPGAWDVVYLFFTLMRGVMFFLVIGLIGSGWNFIKPFISDNEKKLLLIVIPLQILSNIALIILEETAPGSSSWSIWLTVFRVVDISCCIAVMVPILWSVKHLREASQVDGKAAKNLAKLKMFQTFYLMVISFIYMTRIIVFLLDSSLSFRWTWAALFVSELSTLVFMILTGNMFRPVGDNPYLETVEDQVKDLEMEEVNVELS